MAALIPGISVFKGIKDLANKESNRIEEMKKILIQSGINQKRWNESLRIKKNKK